MHMVVALIAIGLLAVAVLILITGNVSGLVAIAVVLISLGAIMYGGHLLRSKRSQSNELDGSSR